jgi:hypothetical protein
LVGIAFALAEDAGGEGAGGFDIGGIVQQDEGLLRDVGAVALGGAFFAAGGVEGEHGRDA